MTTRKSELYRDLTEQLASLLHDEANMIANGANAASLIYHGLPDINWAGFYFVRGAELVLGPFQGKPACVRIPIGKGVCGVAAASAATVLVPDVHHFPGHIACDPNSRSELVVPLIEGRDVLGVLDLDSPLLARFDPVDQDGCERLVALFLDHHRQYPSAFTQRDFYGAETKPRLNRSCAGGAQMKTLIDDAEHWWSRAEETRTIAELLNDPEGRRIMFDIAEGYDQLAQRAADRVARHKPDTIQ